jgi:hypothetical protein
VLADLMPPGLFFFYGPPWALSVENENEVDVRVFFVAFLNFNKTTTWGFSYRE